MIQPDVMDEVPDEVGFYLYRPKNELEFELYGWQSCKIYLSSTGLRIKRSTAPDNAHYGILLEAIEDSYIWSEKIGVPDD